MPKNNLPVVILVRPQLAENIGMVARAMSNFGLKELRLVAPRDGWPNTRARETACGGESIIDKAKAFPDFASATADIHIAYATTARPRDMNKRVVVPELAVKEIAAQVENQRVALVFGPERTGLENEEVVACDTLITIPTTPESSSLNLAQSVVIVGYEWWKMSGKWHVTSDKKNNARISPAACHLPPATKQDWSGLFDQLHRYLDEVNYWRVSHKKPLMWQNLQTMLTRGQWNAQEVRTFRGMLRAVWERRETK